MLRRSSSAVATSREGHRSPRFSDKRTLGQRDYGAKAKKSVLASEVKTSTLVSSPTVSGGGMNGLAQAVR
jgi:hypothetical protein